MQQFQRYFCCPPYGPSRGIMTQRYISKVRSRRKTNPKQQMSPRGMVKVEKKKKPKFRMCGSKAGLWKILPARYIKLKLNTWFSYHCLIKTKVPSLSGINSQLSLYNYKHIVLVTLGEN